jgi:hypothetical protein
MRNTDWHVTTNRQDPSPLNNKRGDFTETSASIGQYAYIYINIYISVNFLTDTNIGYDDNGILIMLLDLFYNRHVSKFHIRYENRFFTIVEFADGARSMIEIEVPAQVGLTVGRTQR